MAAQPQLLAHQGDAVVLGGGPHAVVGRQVLPIAPAHQQVACAYMSVSLAHSSQVEIGLQLVSKQP